MPDPLAGLRVLEVSGLRSDANVTAPYGGALLAGLGADVLLVEPMGGHPLRREGPFPDDAPHPERSGLFWYLAAGKQSIALDLATAAGKRILRELIDGADVLIHDAPAGGTAPLGLDHRHDQLIAVEVTPYGQDGPYRDRPGTDLQFEAISGLLDLTGEPEREPLQLGVPIADWASGQLVAAAVLTALNERASGGRGQDVDLSRLEGACSIMEHSMAIYQYRGDVRRRAGNLGGAAWGIYPAPDGYVGVVSGLGETYQRFRRLIGGALLEDRFTTIGSRGEHADDMNAAILAWLSQRPKQESFEAAQNQRIPFSVLATVEDVMASPQLQAREYLTPKPAGGGHADTPIPGPPFRLLPGGAEPAAWCVAEPPALGRQTASVLAALGRPIADLARLRRAGVLR